jgi:hypothetical protein
MNPHLAGLRVYPHGAALDNRLRLRHGRSLQSARNGIDTCSEFMQAEGSDETVVRAGLQGQDPVQFRGAIGEAKDGEITPGPDVLAHFQTVTVQDVQIQKYKIDTAKIPKGSSPVPDDLNLISALHQMRREFDGGGIGGD